MRLKTLKLAGFKSFVDPTTVPFPSNLVGVIGPNGCGKSNIIDAVRWVMGESSAKQLRGDSMADVIFNGSSARKPVGHASVELVFDNSAGKLQGQYASFSEISVKRKASRDGVSSYYLNGTKCRRRDIMDLFLGTGLGPRSYAIIEQGMISRFVEAKPDDLRVLIEEAAGISKYKERRRETENRMRHTRENLDRINDLREEMAKQLRRLERQSRAAERYRKLKQEERLMQAQLLALRWQEYDQKAEQQDRETRRAEVSVQQRLSQQRALESEIEKGRQRHAESNDSFNEVQGRFYAIGAEIARTEQNLKGMRERQDQLGKDLEQAEGAWHEANAMMKADQQRILELEESLLQDEPQLKQLQKEDGALTALWEEAEQEWHEWQGKLEHFNRLANDPKRDAEIARSRIEQLDRQRFNSERQQQRLLEEQQTLPVVDGAELEQMQQTLQQRESDLQQLREAGHALREQIAAQREENRQTTDRLDGRRGALQQLHGRLTSLEALQQDALGREKSGVHSWLEQSGVADAPRLAEKLNAEAGWERAVETVLGAYLEAVTVEEDHDLLQGATRLQKGEVRFVMEHAGAAAGQESGVLNGALPLSSLVETDLAIGGLLQGVYAVESLQQALQLRPELDPGISVVTRDGVWIGREWSQVVREDDAQEGVLQREQTIRAVKEQLQQIEADVASLESLLEEGRQRQREQEQLQEQQQNRIDQQAAELASSKADLSGKLARQDQLSSRREQIDEELLRLESDIRQAREGVRESRSRLEIALAATEESELQRQQMESRRGALREAMDRSRDSAREKRDQLHRLTVQVESSRTRLESTRNGLVRMEEQLATSQERKRELLHSKHEMESPIQLLKEELEKHLAKQLVVENELTDARRKLEEIEHHLRELDGERMEAEQDLQKLRSAHEKLLLEGQEIRVRRQTLDEQLQESGYQREPLLQEMPEEATAEQWQQDVDQMALRIQRLGPINLAAIDEYQTETERKEHLDQQHDDLVDALTTLENAIGKIDRETRTRFRETFERINDGLKSNFPQLFGGGRAYLEMTGEDLLDTGVTVMAQPPGKRNSTIHLLSGGEKALTAVALVFSIFELNPAPFCMLDEVDAPLDEANVGRFSNMVKKMSERVQFIFITHNKATMEISDQLSGVTMHEPGVSRMVAVDIEEAEALAASQAV